MKRLLVCVCAAVLFVSCATLPKPQGSDSSLVVGNLVLDFPDGFFSQPPTTLDRHVEVTFKDLTDGALVRVYTQNRGYYYFAGKPGDSYVMQTWSATVSGGNGEYSIGPFKIGWLFTAQPGKMTYLGDVTVVFRRPNRTKQVGNSAEWDYDIDSKVNMRPAAVKEFLKETEAESPWLDYEVVAAKLTRYTE